ncbi:putative membrane protein [Pedobacter sp. UYEF25]
MKNKKYKYSIVGIFLFVFMAKMVISGAPVFFASADKAIMNAVIMQIEVTHGPGDDAKDGLKFTDFKLLEVIQPIPNFSFFYSFIELKKNELRSGNRIVNSYHPTVATPPPNFS